MGIINRMATETFVENEINATIPEVSTADNGKIFQVVDGTWQAVELQTETWEMQLEDGTTVTKQVVVIS